jgi:hypothetical protein
VIVIGVVEGRVTPMFTIGGNKVKLTKEAVEGALRGVEPQTVKKYKVEIGGVFYPIKQVICVASNLPPAAFISTDAYRILRNLGFEITQ